MKIVTPIILVVVAGALVFWYVAPTYTQIGVLRTQLSGYQSALSQVQAAEQQRDSLISRYNSLSTADLDRLNVFLPDSVNDVGLAITVDNIAAHYGSSIYNVNFSTTNSSSAPVSVMASSSAAYSPLSFSFSTTMSYGDFISFLKDLEGSLQLFEVSSITFNPVDNGDYSFNVTLNAYSLN